MERIEENQLVKRINSRIQCERCEIERKIMNGMDGQC